MLVMFKDNVSEVMINTNNIAYITRSQKDVYYRGDYETTEAEVTVYFTSGKSYTFLGKDAEAVWDYFTGLCKQEEDDK